MAPKHLQCPVRLTLAARDGFPGMSKHFFHVQQPRPLHVDVGWDRPLGHFYLNITDPAVPTEAPEGAENIYISMDDPSTYPRSRGPLRGGLSLAELQQRLAQFDITLPPGLLDALVSDQATNAGNTITHW